MGVYMVHSGCVPSDAAGRQKRGVTDLAFPIDRVRQFGDLERSNCRAISRGAILGKADKSIIGGQNPPTRPCDARISSYDRTDWVFMPRPY